MAYICRRATLFARRFNPSFSYISHHHHHQHPDADGDDNKRNQNPGMRSFGTYLGNYANYSGPGSVIHRNRFVFGGIGNGVGGHRYMSTSIDQVADKAEFLSDMADAPVELIASQAPVMSEVAIAAADSAIPVAALQYLIDGVHHFTGFSWSETNSFKLFHFLMFFSDQC